MSGHGRGTSGQPKGRPRDSRPLSWLIRQKVSVPDRVVGHVERAALVDRIMPTRRRLTVLKAPGGFGKTTLLGECCRRLREQGIPTAWVSVDDQDEPAVLDTYIAYACQREAAGTLRASEKLARSGPGQAESATESRTGIAMQQIAELDGPFVLVLDEVDRIENPGSAALLEFLLQRGPPNLHLAFACRALPAGLNIVGAMLESRAAIVSTDELRFSRSEVSQFFGGKLTRRELAALMSQSAGWPIALRISRNEREKGEQPGAHTSREFVENWVESRLFAGLDAEDREFLLDIGLFDWMDAALLDEVLERNDSARRIDVMPVLVGLLEPVRDGEAESWRLHPLVREHCARQRFRESPERFRAIHGRIADALVRRGETVAAMRHAVEAGEPFRAGEILERAGGVFLWYREGLARFQAANRWLREEVIEARPHLALVRCLALILSGRIEEARQRYRGVAASLGGVDAAGSDAEFELAASHCMVRGTLALYGGERMGARSVQAHVAGLERFVESPRLDLLARGPMELGLCIAYNMTARFGAAHERAERARRCFARNPYMTMFVDIQVGQAAMAQGRVRDAKAHYHRAEKAAKKSYVVDVVPAAMCEAHLQELALECNAPVPSSGARDVPGALVTLGSPFPAYAAAAGGVVGLRLRDEGQDSALESADEMLAYVRDARLPALVRYVSAIRISLLAMAGRVAEGEEAWARDGLPETAGECVDLAGQTWREMEALGCARLRLMIGHERFEAGRGLAAELRGAAAARGLRRTLMRGLALSVVLEQRAGDTTAAAEHLEDYLRLYAETPYAGPLVCERADCAHVAAAYLARTTRSAAGETAQSLLEAMERADGARLVLSAREWEVLQRLEGRRDKQIAAELGLGPYGVRYHLRKLFAKLGASNRAEALRRAREMGLLRDDF